MAIVININDYRNKKQLERRITKLAFDQWESEEERICYMTEQADKDLEEWDKIYPIQDIAEL